MNVGGLALGVLIAGAFAQYLPDPTHLVLAVYGAALLLGLVAVAAVRETVAETGPPKLELRRPAMPEGACPRRRFVSAGLLVAAGFGVNGFFSSLAPQFVREALGVRNELLVAAGVALVFLVALLAQLLAPVRLLRRAGVVLAALLSGTVLLGVALAAGSAVLFLIATAVSGSAVGVAVRRGLVLTEELAAPRSRAGLSASFFIAAYLGLVVPTLTLDVLTQAFGSAAAVAALVVIVSTTAIAGAVVGRPPRHPAAEQGQTSGPLFRTTCTRRT